MLHKRLISTIAVGSFLLALGALQSDCQAAPKTSLEKFNLRLIGAKRSIGRSAWRYKNKIEKIRAKYGIQPNYSGDFDDDGEVTANDVRFFDFCVEISARKLGLGICTIADLNSSGTIDVTDLGIIGDQIAASANDNYPPPTPTPTP